MAFTDGVFDRPPPAPTVRLHPSLGATPQETGRPAGARAEGPAHGGGGLASTPGLVPLDLAFSAQPIVRLQFPGTVSQAGMSTGLRPCIANGASTLCSDGRGQRGGKGT